MTIPSQLDFMDGGERAPGNSAYYSQLGVTTTHGSVVLSGKYFFASYANQGGTWVPNNNFSSAFGYAGVRAMFDGLNGQNIQLLNSASQTQIDIAFNSNGSISVSSGGTVLGTSAAGLINPNVIFFLEYYFKVDLASGSVILRLNGNPAPILTIAGANTEAYSGNVPITYFNHTLGNISSYFYFRDLYIHDGTGSAPFNTFLGNGGCELSPPNANASVAFTPNGNASNFANAAENPPNPTVDYNSSSTVGAQDTFTVTPLPSTVQSVIAVKVFNYSYKNDSGARAIQNLIVSDGVTVDGAETYLSESPVVVEDIFVYDPATSAPFTVSAVNALNIGYVVAA